MAPIVLGSGKALFKDVKVYSREQDRKKPVLKRLYEKIVGGLSHVLENEPREQVATVAEGIEHESTRASASSGTRVEFDEFGSMGGQRCASPSSTSPSSAATVSAGPPARPLDLKPSGRCGV